MCSSTQLCTMLVESIEGVYQHQDTPLNNYFIILHHLLPTQVRQKFADICAQFGAWSSEIIKGKHSVLICE